MLTADCHNDLLLAVRYQRERGHPDPFGEIWLPQLLAGHVRLQVLPVCTEEQFVGEGALRRALLLVHEARRLALEHADKVAIVESGAEVASVLESGRIALVLAVEGGEPVGSTLELVDTLADLGVRMCSLTWNRRTMLADGVGEQDTGGRLTALGVEAVQRMGERGILVDVSHLSEAGFSHLLEVTQGPVIASHSSCRAVHDHPRNLSDDQLRALAARDGFVALNAYGPFLRARSPRRRDFVDHVVHAISVVGPERVGLGTDFILDVAQVVDPVLTGLLVPADERPHTKGLVRPGDLPALADDLRTRLGPELARNVMGDNLVRFLSRTLR